LIANSAQWSVHAIANRLLSISGLAGEVVRVLIAKNCPDYVQRENVQSQTRVKQDLATRVFVASAVIARASPRVITA
jgi:hypothetical protein